MEMLKVTATVNQTHTRLAVSKITVHVYKK